MRLRVTRPSPSSRHEFARHGALRVPSDKSITQRALLLASIARGTSRIVAPLDAGDPAAVRRVVEQLGARVVAIGDRLEVTGVAEFAPLTGSLDFANSGTGARLAIGLLAGRGATATITGDASLRRRPMGRVVRPLERMGVRFEAADRDRLPLRIISRPPLEPFTGELEVASAQVKSAVLLAALGAAGESRLVERRPTRAHTEALLACFGAPTTVETSGTGEQAVTTIALRGPTELRATTVHVPADPSAAAFHAALAALMCGPQLCFEELLLSPRRTGFFDWLERAGARVRRRDVREREGELVGTLEVAGGEARGLRGVDVAPEEVPDLVDELPLVAVVAAFARGTTRVHGARELRFKESDRIAAIGEGLTRMGASFVALEDGFVVAGGGATLHGAEVDSHGDHRVAMGLAIAGLFARGATTIRGWECAAISYPRFLEDVSKLLGDGGASFEVVE